MKTRKSPRWYYEGRAILVLLLIVVAFVALVSQVITWYIAVSPEAPF